MLTEKQTPRRAPEVSIIVPSYNSARTIRACLEAIRKQETTRACEVIVVDSSADETGDIVEREYAEVRLLRLKERAYAGAARNAGVRASRGKYVVMIDSDCIVARDAVERMIERHEQGEYAGVGGSIGNGTPESLSGTIGYLIEFREFMPSAPLRAEKGIPTANIAYRREVFDLHGYFDEDMWPAEDILFNWRLCEAGERLLFDPEIRAVHLNRTGWRDVLSHQVKLGSTSALARRRGELSGGVLLRHPALIIFMPLYRLMKAARWFFSHDKKAFVFFLAAWPLYLLAALWWSWGFMREALSNREQ